MEPDMSIESSSMIRVAVLPIGTVPANTLRDYYSMLLPLHMIPLSGSSSFSEVHLWELFIYRVWKGTIKQTYLFMWKGTSNSHICCQQSYPLLYLKNN